MSKPSIKSQLVNMQMLNLLTMALVGVVAMAVFFYLSSRASELSKARSVANNLAQSLESSLLFLDAQSAEKTLQSLRFDQAFVYARVLDAKGDVFATFGSSEGFTRGVQYLPESPGYLTRFFMLEEVIGGDGPAVGRVQLVGSSKPMVQSIHQLLFVTLAITALGVFLARLLASRLQLPISHDVSALIDVMTWLQDSEDYKAGLKRLETIDPSNAELDRLKGQFVRLMDQVQRRDIEIHRMNENLEQKIHQRTAELKNIQKVALESARLAGKAEVSSSILHNVGNVLNSVGISSELMHKHVRSLPIVKFHKSVGLLEEHRGDSSFMMDQGKGPKLIEFMQQVAGEFNEISERVAKEVSVMGGYVDHIKNIITVQQSFSKSFSSIEEIGLNDLVNDALKLGGDMIDRYGITVHRSVPDESVMLDKHKVLQILTNLVSNSKHALKDVDQVRDEPLNIWVNVIQEEDQVEFVVRDNGVGIRREDLEKIFSFGFTTKPNGNGYGLHTSVLTAEDLGGSLTAESDGPGMGATFRLIVPTGLGS